ncbi:MAG TPA: hypothetical protein VLI05_00475 [Candidatus Saccharimonadia bacterium]|nr:hypothetical protein [Candidatus Saccharimonadia bacterium]
MDSAEIRVQDDRAWRWASRLTGALAWLLLPDLVVALFFDPPPWLCLASALGMLNGLALWAVSQFMISPRPAAWESWSWSLHWYCIGLAFLFTLPGEAVLVSLVAAATLDWPQNGIALAPLVLAGGWIIGRLKR